MFSPKGYNYTDPAPLEPDGPPKTGLRRFLEIVSHELAGTVFQVKERNPFHVLYNVLV